jgi:prepilin-type N-terminal cleavage/methylation domain-containing protein
MKKPYASIGRRGFTLLELIIVIFIIALLASLVFPSFGVLSKRQLSSDARRIASLLQYLSDSAMASKETYSVDFDFQKSSISWKGPEGDKTESLRTLAGVDLQSKGMTREGLVTVFFGSAGILEYIEVLLKDDEKGMKVTFNPISGRAKILTGEEQDDREKQE